MVEKRNIRRKSQMARRSLSMMMAVVLFCACARQFEELDVVDVPQGEPALVSLTFSVPEMPAMTRAAGIDPESSDARTLQDLWIGFYDSETGNRVAQHYTALNVSLSYHQSQTINNIPTVSGKCIIVAVANVGINSGLVAGKDQKATLLSDLLQSDAAATFGGFQQIAMVMGSPDAVVRASPSLVMCGTYSRNRSVAGANSLAGGYPHGNDDDMTPVDIYPGSNTLAGAIHLRRLDSYITFNLIPAENVTVTPLSWQVCNLPGIGYVFDQEGKNAADLAAAPGTEIWTQWSSSGDSTSGDNSEANAALNASYYHNSQIFGSNMFTRSDNGFSFDFFQMENKHTGLLEGTLESNGVKEWYPLREREYKTDEVGLNTGWYSSLVSETDYRTVANTLAAPSSEKGLSNNNATYVVIRARVEYYYLVNDSGVPVNNYAPVSPGNNPDADPHYVRRVGNALYTIHLGYCDDKDNRGNPTLKTANDFNCFRNTKYTYTVHINGVDNIRVEAVTETNEPQSGAEGTVTDLVSTLITLDSHYGVFNLGLTDKQREALFWRIQSPFDNEVIDLVGYSGETDLFVGSNLIDVTKDPNIRAALSKNQFYNWIQIRPTTGAETVAEYPGDPRLIGRRIRNIDNQAGNENIIYPLNKIEPNPYWNAELLRIEGIFPDADPTSVEYSVKEIEQGKDKGVWYLDQLCDPVHFPHPFNTSTEEDEVKWYTFFIDEFVYEYEYDPKEHSLTAEYDDMPGDNYQGQEEMFSGTMDINKWRTFANQDNRRLWLGLGNMYISKDRESIYSDAFYLVTQESIQTYYGDEAEDGIGLEHTNESYKGASSSSWWDAYNNGVYDNVDGLLNMYNYVTKNQNSSYGDRVNWANVRMTESSVKTTKLRVGAYHTKGVAKRGEPEVGDVTPFTYYIPDHPDKFMMGCLARNRDLNHDDIVGANEMRWYLPTTPVYTRMMLGAVSLRTPLFNAAEYDQNSMIAGTGTHFSHYAGSDNRQLWAEELAAIGGLGNARTMRCVRNLGQYMNLSPNEDAYKLINAAYIERKAEDGSNPRETVRIIDMAYYHPVALRPAIQERDYLPIHDVTSILSAASRSFKYARSDCNTSNIVESWLLGQLKPGDDGRMWIGDETLWTESASMNGICRAYYENWNRSDLGTWRVPNITELGVLVLLGIVNLDPERHISCTREYFIGEPEKSGRNQYYMKVGGGKNPVENMITASAGANGNIYLRCVKDVIE